MKMIGLARLGRDAELKYLPSGECVANLSLAVNYGKKGDDGNRPTQWIEASFWGKPAEVMNPYLLKGTVHCFFLSDVHIEEYQGRNGTGHKLAARVDGVELGPRVDGGGGGGSRPAPAPAPAQRPAPAPAPRQAPAPAAPARSSSGFDDMDDVPFK